MPEVVSVSLGSSQRDHQTEVELLGSAFTLKRVGTNGDLAKAREMLMELDGKAAAIGLGGIDLYLIAGGKKYVIRDARKLKDAVKKTPVVDGSGLKHTLERALPGYLESEGFDIRGKKVLMVSAVDRFGMAEGFDEKGCEMTFGDLPFGLGIPIPLRSLTSLRLTASLLLPIVTRLPFQMIYPTGGEQEKAPKPKYAKWYQQADIIAGDFLLIRKYLPEDLSGKMVVTNTTTEKDMEELKNRGVTHLVTSTPRYEGRSFGTNVMEALMVALIDKPLEQIAPEDYSALIEKLDLRPQIFTLNP